MFLKVILFFVFSEATASMFSYYNQGFWSREYPDCGGNIQSPIEINKGQVRHIKSEGRLRWNGYGKCPMSMEIQNNGHTLKLTGKWYGNNIPYLSGYPLDGEYLFHELHFHWSNNISAGSEHTVNGERYSVEMHMVHFNRKYGTFEQAKTYRHGVAVIGILFQKSTNNRGPPGLSKCLEYVNAVRFLNQRRNIPPFPLSTLINRQTFHTNQLIHYEGSFTTPPCTQGVVWILPNAWQATHWISLDQWNKLIMVNLWKGEASNYRFLQPLNDRLVISTY